MAGPDLGPSPAALFLRLSLSVCGSSPAPSLLSRMRGSSADTSPDMRWPTSSLPFITQATDRHVIIARPSTTDSPIPLPPVVCRGRLTS